MEINSKNWEVGNKATANVLLLYFHLLQECGISNDQTVYIDREEFDARNLVEVEIVDGISSGLDQALIREGASVFMVCDLDDIVSEFEDDFHSQPFFKEMYETLSATSAKFMPEIKKLLSIVEVGEREVDYTEYKAVLDEIYQVYVLNRMRRLVSSAEL